MKKILLSTFLLLGFCVQAQETSNQFSLNFLMPSVEYETAISKNSTIDANLGFGFGYHDASYLDKAEYGIYPDFQLQYRHYYNLKKRLEKGKKISENSGNYIALSANVSSGEPIIGDMRLNNDYSGFVGPLWGLQRVYNNNFKLNLNLGFGMGFNDREDPYFATHIGLQLGFKLGKEKQ